MIAGSFWAQKVSMKIVELQKSFPQITQTNLISIFFLKLTRQNMALNTSDITTYTCTAQET
jgi:hypothetical protein